MDLAAVVCVCRACSGYEVWEYVWLVEECGIACARCWLCVKFGSRRTDRYVNGGTSVTLV